MYPPNKSAASPPIFSCPTSSNYMTFFFFGTKLVIWKVMTFFSVFTLLHFTVVSKNLGNRAGVSNLLNHHPQSRKIAKNGQFCRIIPLNTQHILAPLRTGIRIVYQMICKKTLLPGQNYMPT